MCERMILHLLCFSHFPSRFHSFNLSLLDEMSKDKKKKKNYTAQMKQLTPADSQDISAVNNTHRDEGKHASIQDLT